jgi:hypothetical protein
MSPIETRTRLASAADAPAFGRLLHAFNTEFGESTPDAEVIAERAAPLIESGEVTVPLLARLVAHGSIVSNR